MLKNLLINGASYKLNWAAIELKGEDAQSFLNSQTTNNVNLLANDEFHWNSLLDISGKVVSYFLLLKKTSSSITLLIPKELVQLTIERLDKYLIAEDVEILSIEKEAQILFGQKRENAFNGTFLNFPMQLHFDSSEALNQNEFEDLWFLQGDPNQDTSEVCNVLVNNTTLEDLAVDYKKGCFLGQETVSKIHTRRGAAFKFVILELSESIEIALPHKLTIDNKKIGTIFSIREIEGKFFARAELNRENRLDKKSICFDQKISGIVHYAPFIKKKISDIASDLYDEAIVDFQKDNEELAITKLTKVIELDPLFEDAYESLGVIYGRNERFEKAIELMQKLSEINQSSVMAHTNMSLYHMRLGNIEQAEEHKSIATVKSFEHFGKVAEEKKIKEELQKKEQEELIQREGMFKQVLEIDNEDALANYGMGDIELQRKNYIAAIQYLKKAIEGDTKYSVAYLSLAKAFRDSQQIDEAIKVLKKGIEVSTKNGDLMPANEMQSILVDLTI